MQTGYTAVVKQVDEWWIGWIEEVSRVNCQESTHDELVEPHGFTAVVPLVSSAKPAEACPPSPRLRRTPAAHSSTA